MHSITFSSSGTIVLYALIVLLTTMSMHMASFVNEKRAKRYVLIAVLIAGLFSALRFDVGKDYLPFFEYGKRIASLSSVQAAMGLSRGVENSFSFLAYYSEKLFGNSAVIIGLYGFITQALMLTGMWRLRKHMKPEAATFLYMCSFYWRTYNIFRQALAIAIVFFAITYLLENKRLIFVLLVVLATLFHRTAIVSIVLLWYFRTQKKNNLFSKIVDYVLPVVLALSIESMFTLASRISILSRYVKYYSDYQSESIFTLGTGLVLIQVGAYIFYRIKKKNTESSFETSAIFDKAMFCMLVFYLLGFQIQFAARIGLYFTVLSYCSFAKICGRTRTRYSKFKFSAFQLIFIGVSIMYFISYMNSNGYGQIPYSLIIP